MDFKLCIILLAACRIASGKVHWGYEETDFGPGDWGRMAPLCTRQSQSPINIVSSSTHINTSYHGLVLNVARYKNGAVTGSLINNGHVPEVLVDKTKGKVTLNRGPLGQILYTMQQFHLHFGCNSSAGSEHTVDGNHFAAEVDGGFNEWMEYIAVALRNVKRPNEISYRLRNSIPLAKLVPDLASTMAPYYTYKGSLTTPPCYESVQWIVMKNPISITESQLEMMRSLKATNGHPLCNNFRPVRPLNGRKCFKWPWSPLLNRNVAHKHV